jgi:hypothetical protein
MNTEFCVGVAGLLVETKKNSLFCLFIQDYSLTTFARDPVWGDQKEFALLRLLIQDYSLTTFARDPVWGDQKEKALPRCARLRFYFIHTLMHMNMQRV